MTDYVPGADYQRGTGQERISFWRRKTREMLHAFGGAMQRLPIPSGKQGDLATTISAIANADVEVTVTGDSARDKLRKLTNPKNRKRKYTTVA